MYIHGAPCDYCGQNILHPQHDMQRKAHLAVRFYTNFLSLQNLIIISKLGIF